MPFSSEQGTTPLRIKVNRGFSFDLSSFFFLIIKPEGTLHRMIPKASHSPGQAQEG